MVGESAFLTTKLVLRLLVTNKSFGGRNAAAPTLQSLFIRIANAPRTKKLELGMRQKAVHHMLGCGHGI
jgi:hypothetical protein